MTKLITNKQYESYAKNIEKSNLKNIGHSLSWVGILSHAKIIKEIRSDDNSLVVIDNWKEILNQIGKIV
jgi:hypothetical protein